MNIFPNTPLLDISCSVVMCWGFSSLAAIVNRALYACPVDLSANLTIGGIIGSIMLGCSGC